MFTSLLFTNNCSAKSWGWTSKYTSSNILSNSSIYINASLSWPFMIHWGTIPATQAVNAIIPLPCCDMNFKSVTGKSFVLPWITCIPAWDTISYKLVNPSWLVAINTKWNLSLFGLLSTSRQW